MKSDLYTIRKTVPGLSYVFTENGVELPVLDITHPLFISSIDDVKLKEMLKKQLKSSTICLHIS